jgi:hypothetical protein
MTAPAFEATFRALRDVLRPYEAELVTVRDEPGDYYLDTRHVQLNRKPLFFGSVRITKQYVSFHLMPVYAWPELLNGASEALLRRMQGKSCFNFKQPDDALFAELAELTRRGLERYREHGFLS